ncbi:MAG: 23S rRNA (adenine(2030)-N(6))-methyltransferase RlmJ [Marivibrio sp.]|uniref:23S rRNA (adenine(2030)-N(6))-methyltransferase RlmJ n=1 Tax=Marivibrio sp. TaxID=2039719 RepID=UPI0032EE934F
MNYRHAYHAGNFADALKHWALLATLERLTAKAKPFFALDTHAGAGFYDLAREPSGRTGEADGGIGRLLTAAADAPESLQPYLDAVRALNEGEPALRWYPGSPYLIAARLRPEDRLIACDLEAGEGATLAETLAPFPNAKHHLGDGYAAVPSMLPPTERRGLVLIDPPFERRDEFERLGRAAALGVKHFANGVFALWHPIKDRAAVDAYLAALPRPKGGLAQIELAVAAPTADGPLTACGLTLLNPPYGLVETIEAGLPWLAATLAAGDGADARVRWLAAPA